LSELPTRPDEAFAEIALSASTQYRTVEDMVTWAIREAIVIGLYQPGDKLPQEKLATELGVSRVPVRASLRKLEAEGLVIISPHKGATVRRLAPEEVAEIYELRIVLETYALQSAIEHLTDEQIDALSQLADQLDASGDADELPALREQFTSTLLTMAKRPRTADIVARLRADVGRYWLGFRAVREEHYHISTHRQLVDALRARDAGRAQTWIREHFTAVSKELQRIMANPDGGSGAAAEAPPPRAPRSRASRVSRP
jgi:DNA-binding GntR family transcriptional regulator